MSKVKEYIKRYTRMCINLDPRNCKPIPWLTPYRAEQVAQIAREEAIEKACEWLTNHNDYICGGTNGVAFFDMTQLVKDFKKAMEDKV